MKHSNRTGSGFIRLSEWFVLGVLCLILAGCGGGKAVKSGGASGWNGGGGYYKDDGPHSVVPSNLDQVPDAEPRIEPFYPASLRPYTALGTYFVPQTELRTTKQHGRASWYGKRFHGSKTSIGETYDMYQMTAAHPTLPLPCYVRVTNAENGRSVIVRVNDRGPFLRERIIDLSYVAAYKLGYINAGSADVMVEPITHEQIRLAGQSGGYVHVPDQSAQPEGVPIATAPAIPELPVAVPNLPVTWPSSLPSTQITNPDTAAGGIFLQLGVFDTLTNAAKMYADFQQRLDIFAERLHLFDDQGRYRIQIGPFPTESEARATALLLGPVLDSQPFITRR